MELKYGDLLRPLESLPLAESEHVVLTLADAEQTIAEVSTLFTAEEFQAALDDAVTLEEVRGALAKMSGSLSEAVIEARESEGR